MGLIILTVFKRNEGLGLYVREVKGWTSDTGSRHVEISPEPGWRRMNDVIGMQLTEDEALEFVSAIVFAVYGRP